MFWSRGLAVLMLILVLGHAHGFPTIGNPWPYLKSAFGWLSPTESRAAPVNKEPPLRVKTLKYIAIITRHGSRSPVLTYPNDPYPYHDNRYWPAGNGQLTKYGHQQMYASGINYRRRLNGFLPLQYNPNYTLARTNLFDRDFTSAACFLAGLYPPQGYQLWNSFIPWQPIPIWQEPFDIAEVIHECPAFNVEMVKAFKKLTAEEAAPNKQLLDYLAANAGFKNIGLMDVFKIWDALTMQCENGYKLPKWASSVYPEKMESLFSKIFYTYTSGTPKMIRLSGGPALRNITKMLNSKADGSMKPAERLVYLEAAHDITIQALLAALGVTTKLVIKTSASMAFELHKPPFAEHQIQVVYFNDSSTHVPYHVKVPACGKTGICTLTKFNKIVDSVAPEDWTKECQVESLRALSTKK